MERQFKETGERIRRARRAKDLTQQDVADALKVTVQSVSQWERGRTRPEGERFEDLALLLSKDLEYLKSGKIRDETRGSAPASAGFVDLSGRIAQFIPSKEFAVDCLGLTGGDDLSEDSAEGAVISQFIARGKLFAYQIEDDEMEPSFRQGDIVVLDTAVPVRVGDFVLVIDRERNAVALREVRGTRLNDEDRVVLDLRPLNPEYPSFSVAFDDEFNPILGTVVEHRRVWRRS